MLSVSKKPTDRAVVCSTPAVMKKPAAVKKPAAAVKKRPAAALSPSSDSEAEPPSVKRTAPSPSLSSSEPPSHHRLLSIDEFAAAHLESLGSQQAGEVVLAAMGALRRTVRPDRTCSVSVPDPKGAATRRCVRHKSTNPFGTYDLEVELEPHHSRR